MTKKANNNIHLNYFLLIILITLSIVKISSNPSVSKEISNPLRNLIEGSDIVKQIDEQCLENVNVLKYNIILNSTAFLLNLNISKRRNLYSTIKDLDGKDIGIEKGNNYEDLIKAYFPSSTTKYSESTERLLMSLLFNNVEAIILEEPVAQYYKNQANSITFFNDKLINSNYGFGYSKNINSKIINEFDEYLIAIKKSGDYKQILDIWTGEYNSLKSINRDLTGNKGVIKAGFNVNMPPFAYVENNQKIGFEVDLLYRFAKIYGYQIELISLTAEEQITKIINNEIDLVGGCFSLTEPKKLFMNFSTVIYEGGAVLVIRNDIINKEANKNESNNKKVIVKNQNGVQNLGNVLTFPVNGLPDEQSHTGTCVFPENLTEIYSFECTISGLTEDNPMVNGFTYGLITDYIEVNGIVLNQIYSYIPSHILGQNLNSNDDIEHKGTMCPKMNAYLAGVDNIEEILNTVNLGFGIYRKAISIPKTQANLYIKKGSSSCEAICQEAGNNIYLTNANILVRYSCICTFESSSNSEDFKADFDSMKFNYINNIDKKINMEIKNKEMTKNAMSNLYKNTAKFPTNLNQLNTFLVTNLINGRCLDGIFTFNAIGVLYKTISQNQYFITDNPIRTSFILKRPYDLEEAEIQVSINAKIRGTLLIHKDYYENQNNKGEYLYLTSKDNVNIQASYCEGNIYPTYTNQTNNTNSNYTGAKERVEAVTLRDEMGIPKWLIVILVLLITALIMMILYFKIKTMDNDVEYVIKYGKTNDNSINNSVVPQNN